MSSQLLFLVNLPLSLALALGGSPVIFYCLVLRRQLPNDTVNTQSLWRVSWEMLPRWSLQSWSTHIPQSFSMA